MTEKNIFVYILFLLLNISDFSLVFFGEIATPPLKKVITHFSSNPSVKVEFLSTPFPYLENLVGLIYPPAERAGGAHYGPLENRI